jgi:hypothetical protein
LHNGEAIEIEPADSVGIELLDGDLFGGFEPGAERGDAIFDEVEPSTAHDVVLGVIGGGEDFFWDTECGADFGAAELAIFEELKVGRRELGLNDFIDTPKDDGLVGRAGAARRTLSSYLTSSWD